MAGRKAWRQTATKVEISQNKEESLTRRSTKKKNSIHLISPNGELRQRFFETVIDVKENIPSECPTSSNTATTTRRITRSFQIKLDIEKDNSKSPVIEARKRRIEQAGPPPKRASIEKTDVRRKSDETDISCAKSSETPGSSSISSRSFSSVSGKSTCSNSSRARSVPLPVMEEEDEVFNLSTEDHSSEGTSEIDVTAESIGTDDTKDETEEESEEDDEKGEDECDGNVDEEEEVEYVDEEEEDDEDDLEHAPLQNENFASMKRHMNDVSIMPPPASMKIEKCDGIGAPDEVWSLMVSRDDLARASACLLRGHPDMTVEMRTMLIDWMMEVCDTENLHRETFHLAVDYVDRFLESNEVVIAQETFQLAGTAALFIASKYEEIYPPKCVDFACLTDGAFSSDDVRKMEVVMVKALNWTLGPITSIHWLSTYLQLLGHTMVDDENGHVYESNYFVPELMREDFIHMAKILDFLLFEMDSLSYTYRTISAAVLFACYEPRDAVENATGFNYDQLLRVIEFVEPVVTVFERHRQTGDPFPVNDRVHSDDIHNMQTYIKYKDVVNEVKRERELRQNSCSPSSSIYLHSSTSIASAKQFYN